MRSLLKLMKPDNFEDISAVLALYRPGPMGANAHTDYALRKNKIQEVIPIHPELEEPLAEILGGTYGLIVYQEQVMAVAQKLAGYSLGQADILRRAMGKKKKSELDKQFAGFSPGHAGQRLLHGGRQDPVGHPAARSPTTPSTRPTRPPTACISYWTAYLKAHYAARVHGGPADLRGRRQGQVGDLPERMPAHGHHGAAAGRQRVRAELHPCGQRHPLRHGRHPQRRRQRRRSHGGRP